MDKVFFHVDLDAFFASVEQLIHPEYRNKPVIVGGLPGDRRAVVSTASYEARKYGVHSAQPLVKALQLCPNGIYLRGNMKLYHEMSQKVMSIFDNYSPDVIQISVDEAFLDMTGTEKLFGKSIDVAQRLKKEVKDKTGLTVSVGIGPTMYIAKIASGLNKPDGLTLVESGKEEIFMQSLPIDKLWGVGTKTLEHLKSSGFTTTKSIYDKSLSLLTAIFGNATGNFLYNAVRGNKDVSFGTPSKNHSISSETTYDFDLKDRYIIETALLDLCYTVLFRMHKEKVYSKTLAIKIRYEDFTTVSVQQTYERPFLNADDMFERCRTLFNKKYNPERSIRLLGVAAEKTESNSKPLPSELFDLGEGKKNLVEEAIFKMTEKDSSVKIKKARQLL